MRAQTRAHTRFHAQHARPRGRKLHPPEAAGGADILGQPRTASPHSPRSRETFYRAPTPAVRLPLSPPHPRGGGAARRYLRAPRLTPSLRRRRAREPSTAAGGEGRRGGPGAERCGRKGHLGSSPPLLSARGRALPPAPLGQV